MRLLLTSAGITNKTISRAFEELLGSAPDKKRAVYVMTAGLFEEGDKRWLLEEIESFADLGFAELDLIELAGLPRENAFKRIESSDVVIVGGGVTYHLLDVVKRGGFDDALRSVADKGVYVGVSAGSIIASENVDLSHSASFYNEPAGSGGIVSGLGFVDFQIIPHLNSGSFPSAAINVVADKVRGSKDGVYAIDDDGAVVVTDEGVTVATEGEWKLFSRNGHKVIE